MSEEKKKKPKPPVPPKMVPAMEKQKDDLYDQITTVVEGLLPTMKKESNKMKKLVGQLKGVIQSAGSDQVKAVQGELTKAIISINNKQGTVEDLFISKLDDWAATLGADPAIVAGLKLLGRPEMVEFLRTVATSASMLKKGETHITIHIRTFLLGWIGTIILAVMFGIWVGMNF